MKVEFYNEKNIYNNYVAFNSNVCTNAKLDNCERNKY